MNENTISSVASIPKNRKVFYQYALVFNLAIPILKGLRHKKLVSMEVLGNVIAEFMKLETERLGNSSDYYLDENIITNYPSGEIHAAMIGSVGNESCTQLDKVNDTMKVNGLSTYALESVLGGDMTYNRNNDGLDMKKYLDDFGSSYDLPADRTFIKITSIGMMSSLLGAINSSEIDSDIKASAMHMHPLYRMSVCNMLIGSYIGVPAPEFNEDSKGQAQSITNKDIIEYFLSGNTNVNESLSIAISNLATDKVSDGLYNSLNNIVIVGDYLCEKGRDILNLTSVLKNK